MFPVSLLVKPVSGACDLRCRYCFYADEMKRRETSSYGTMTPATLENMLRRVFGVRVSEVSLAFQGGEPTLAGLEFFREVVHLTGQYNARGVPVQLSLQTNGMHLNKEWAEFFARHHFLIGLSLDGVQPLHDSYRIDAAGQGTYETVMKAAELLRAHGVEFNVLSVVTAQAAQRAGETYRFFRENGFDHQQYIPCLDPMGEERGGESYSLLPQQYEAFLKEQFTLWYSDIMNGKFVYHRYFDNLVGMLLRHPPESCGMLGECSRQLLVEADGRVYPCDFYALDAYCLGNLNENSLKELERRRDELGFIRKSQKVEPECHRCRWYPLCRGGCRRDRERADGTLGMNYYCSAYQGFFRYAIAGLEQIAQLVQATEGKSHR